jgi:hypothetical protein
MDELDLVRNVYHGIPGPSASESAGARSRLLAAIDDTQPGASRPPAAAGRLAVVRRLARPRIWMPIGAAAAVTAIVIAASVAAPFGQPKATPSSSQPSAAQVLDEAAAAAARPRPGNGNFFAAVIQQMIVGTSGTGVRRFPVGTYWMNRQGSGWFDDGKGITLGQRYYTWPQIQRLPLSPSRLLAHFASMSGSKNRGMQAVTELDEIGDLLDANPASPALRSALFRALAMVPRLELVSATHDPLGRAAAAVYAFTDGNLGRALFFDPATGAVLSYGVVTLHYVPGKPYCPNSVLGFVALAAGYVNSLGQLPPPVPATAGSAASPFALPGCSVPKASASASP